ncbi:MAG TPA: dockerin type I repeat-containing protein [Lacipirellulaceae bacterium]|nr:dockerin type I repeat-containing protein [Lacipirellulaceae bacterium]HMP06242.1 dockerin type I repeat-containing protein [Lacipirellulaceae bacterium]
MNSLRIRTLFVLAPAFIMGLAARDSAGQVLLYDFETEDQHRENNLPSGVPGWGGFGTITLDRGPSRDASAGEWARFHLGDFDLPYDEDPPLNVNWGIVSVSDRFLPHRKDFSSFIGLRLDAKFVSNELLPYEGHTDLEVGFGFMVPGVGEDESLTVYAPPVTLTDEYQTFDVFFADIPFIQEGAALIHELANNAFIKLRFSNTNESFGRGGIYFDEIYGLLGGAPQDNADFNNDGVVDGADFVIWQRGLGLMGQTNNALGDANGDGSVNEADLTIWASQFGPTATFAAIPEPSGALVAVAALPMAMAARRRRQAL